MSAARSTAWLRSGRGLLATSAVLDLVARLPEDILAPALSIVGGTLGSQAIGFVTTWVMLAAAFYTFGHLAYSHLETLPRKERGFRGIFTAGAVLLGIGLQQATEPVVLLGAVFLTVLGVGGLFLWYLDVHDGWAVLDPDGRAVELLASVFPHDDAAEDIESDLAYEGLLGRVAVGFYLLALGMLLSMPVVLAAIVAQILVYAYPVPDVVFLGWALSVTVVPQLSVGPDRPRIMTLEFDFERILIDTIENATRSVQGMISTMFVILGLLGSAGYLFIGISIAPGVVSVLGEGIVSHPANLSISAVQLLWNLLGLMLLPLFAGCYGIWAWVRELRRLPQFLDDWEARVTADDTESVARPPGLVVPPVVAWLLVVVYVHYDGLFVVAIHAIFWPAVVAAGIWTVRWTQRRPVQPATHEHWWITGGLVLQTWSIWVATSLPTLVDIVVGGGAILDMLALPLVITGLLFFLALVPVVERYDSKPGTSGRYLLVVLLFATGILVGSSTFLVPSRFRVFTIGITAATLGLGALLGIVRYYEL